MPSPQRWCFAGRMSLLWLLQHQIARSGFCDTAAGLARDGCRHPAEAQVRGAFLCIVPSRRLHMCSETHVSETQQLIAMAEVRRCMRVKLFSVARSQRQFLSVTGS